MSRLRHWSKDDILTAVIEARKAARRPPVRVGGTGAVAGRSHQVLRAARHHERRRDPPVRLPRGDATSELAKLDHSCVGAAREVFGLFRAWLVKQFTALGHADQADELAMRVLAFSQGTATLFNAIGDDAFVHPRSNGGTTGWTPMPGPPPMDEERTMFVVLLRFADNKDAAPDHMARTTSGWRRVQRWVWRDVVLARHHEVRGVRREGGPDDPGRRAGAGRRR